MADQWEAHPVLDVHADIGEAPTWDAANGVLLWVDITACEIHRFSPDAGTNQTIGAGSHVGAVVPREAGGLVAAVRDGYRAIDGTGDALHFVELPPRPPNTRMNDGGCDPAGRFWAGTMAYDGAPGSGRLYRLDDDWTVTTVLDHVTLSNGLGWDPAGAAMYYIDSSTSRLDVFEFDLEHGSITARRPLVTFTEADGMPDGLCVDDEGCIWVALWGGGQVRRYSPSGRLLGTVTVPASQVTSCAFGGVKGDDLYITTAAHGLAPECEPHAGNLFRCSPGVSGPPAVPFAG